MFLILLLFKLLNKWSLVVTAKDGQQTRGTYVLISAKSAKEVVRTERERQ